MRRTVLSGVPPLIVGLALLTGLGRAGPAVAMEASPPAGATAAESSPGDTGVAPPARADEPSPAALPSSGSPAPASSPDPPSEPNGASRRPVQERPLQYAWSYRMDTRAGAGTRESALQVDGLEAEVIGSYGRKWEFAGQVPLGSEFASRGRGMHFGNLYAIRKWRLGAPTLKIGQFVVPYGNLTTFDVHNRIIQSLSRYSLGVRIDPGVETEGYLLHDDRSEWQVAVTSGDGPYRLDRHGMPLVTGRISHKFEEQGDTIRLGLSGAAGTLPVFSVLGEPVSAAGSPVLGWANKRRLALDAEVEHGIDLFHFEGDIGTDDGRGAQGVWLGWTRPLSASDSLETVAETWRQPEREGRLWGTWLGAEHRLDGLRTLRAALRWNQSREEDARHAALSLTLQLVRQF